MPGTIQFHRPRVAPEISGLLRLVQEEEVARMLLSVNASEPAQADTPNYRAAIVSVLRSAQLVAVGNWIEDRLAARARQLEGELVSELMAADLVNGQDRLFANAEKRINNAFASLLRQVEAWTGRIARAAADKAQAALREHHGVEVAGRAMINAFDPDQPRDEQGQWTETGAVAMRHGMISISRKGEGKEAKWKTKEGDLPEHAKKLGIPPAWKDAHVNPDPKADLQAVGMDAKGRVQRIYSEQFVQRQAEKKFTRISLLQEKRDKIFKSTDEGMKSEDQKTRESAHVLKLIQHTGIRPGSESETGADKQAYGATTLEGRHVHVTPDGVRLRFVGKKGVDLDIPVEDKRVAAMLVERKRLAGSSGKLFSASAADLRDYTKEISGGKFKPKDFRTLKGTETASELVAKEPNRAATMKEYKARVMAVAKRVAEKLGNTPTIALQSYINPRVFHAWKPQT